MNCIFCHTKLMWVSPDGDHCNNCYVGFRYTSKGRRQVEYVHFFHNTDRQYHIQLNIVRQRTSILVDHGLGNMSKVLSLNKLFWIFPQTMPYWINKFNKLLAIS